MQKSFREILKEKGIRAFLMEFKGDLSLIREYFEIRFGFDSKSLSRIMKTFKNYMKQEIEKELEKNSDSINEFLFALKSNDRQNLSKVG